MSTKLNILCFFLIGPFLTHFVKTEPTELEVSGLGRATVDDITRIENNIESSAKQISKKLKNYAEKLQNYTEKMVSLACEKVDNGLKLVDSKIEQLIHYNLTDETCGILTFSQEVKGAFNLLQNCIIDEALSVFDKIVNIYKMTMDISDNLILAVENIKVCANSSSDSDDSIDCLREQKDIVYDYQEKYCSTYHVEQLADYVELFPKTVLAACLVMNSVSGIIDLGIEKKVCLEEKAPRFMQAVHKFVESRDHAKTKINTKVEEIKENMTNYIEQFKTNFKYIIMKTRRFFQRNVE